MELDVVLLSRIQFALTIMFHYLFPPLTIGLGLLIVIFEATYYKTGNEVWKRAGEFWIKLFAVSFAVGVASGIVMEFQFGTNWATYSRFVGDVFGSVLAAEGIFAFFLESGFLAVLVFGRKRVSKGFFLFSAVMVSLGSIFSSVWIIIANSWQQTPAGSHVVQMMRDGTPWFQDGQPVMRAEIVEFWGVVFNPSTVNRLTHVWTGCMVLGGFFVLSICSYYILRGRHLDVAKPCFKVALVFALVGSLLAAATGDSNARMVSKLQPAKLAAMEGHFVTGEGPTGIHVFGIPSFTSDEIYLPIEIPGLLSILVYREFPPETAVIGLDAIPEGDRPPWQLPFIAFHTMVGLGTLFILFTVLGVFFWWRGTLFKQRWLLMIYVVMVLGGFIANEAGWVAAEVGRQPWVVHPTVVKDPATGFAALNEKGEVHYEKIPRPTPDGSDGGMMVVGLRTADAHSKSVHADQVLASIVMFSLIYILLFFVWIFVLNTKIQHGPATPESGDETTVAGFLSAAARKTESMTRPGQASDSAAAPGQHIVEQDVHPHAPTDGIDYVPDRPTNPKDRNE